MMQKAFNVASSLEISGRADFNLGPTVKNSVEKTEFPQGLRRYLVFTGIGNLLIQGQHATSEQ